MNIDKRLDEIVQDQERERQANAHAFNRLQQENVAIRVRLHRLENAGRDE